MPQVRLAEQRKNEGVCYALAEDGVELPVVDLTHPAFDLRLSDEQQHALVVAFLREQRKLTRLPSVVRRALLRFTTRGSVIARALRQGEGTFLDGMTTYLFKLGARNLGAYALPVDRSIAASLPGLCVRLRLNDVAQLLADAVQPRLAAEPKRPLHFLNIAGGPAIDSMNALLLLLRAEPQLLAGRHCHVQVLDRDERGPAFGARALAALRAPGAPLAGVHVSFAFTRYDWAKPRELAPVLAKLREAGALCIASSEGGLFEYGVDDDILGNLRELARAEPVAMVGSVTRNDETMRALKLTSTAATFPRGLPVFSALVARAGWTVTQARARPLSDQVVLEPIAVPGG